MPSRDDVWVQGVEQWLNHISDRLVENLLVAALLSNDGNIPQAINWLSQNRYMGTIGNYSLGKPRALGVDVGIDPYAHDFIKLFWGGWEEEHLVCTVMIYEVLEYLRNKKQRIPDPAPFVWK